MTTTFKVGDAIVWERYNEKLTCTILEIRPANASGYQRAKLRVDGWASTTWEYLDISFIRAADAAEETPRKRKAA